MKTVLFYFLLRANEKFGNFGWPESLSHEGDKSFEI